MTFSGRHQRAGWPTQRRDFSHRASGSAMAGSKLSQKRLRNEYCRSVRSISSLEAPSLKEMPPPPPAERQGGRRASLQSGFFVRPVLLLRRTSPPLARAPQFVIPESLPPLPTGSRDKECACVGLSPRLCKDAASSRKCHAHILPTPSARMQQTCLFRSNWHRPGLVSTSSCIGRSRGKGEGAV